MAHFLNTSGSPGLSQESTFSGPGGMVPHGHHGFPIPAQNPSQVTLKKDGVFGRSNFSQITFELRKMPISNGTNMLPSSRRIKTVLFTTEDKA